MWEAVQRNSQASNFLVVSTHYCVQCALQVKTLLYRLVDLASQFTPCCIVCMPTFISTSTTMDKSELCVINKIGCHMKSTDRFAK